MESDADRLSYFSAGGQLVRHASGDFWAIFDREFALSGNVESTQPALVARSIDVASLPKEAVLEVGGAVYRVKRHEPDGTGMTMLVLGR